MVHISQFYPCSSIDIACELYYVCELGKYLFVKYNEQLSLDGVVIKKIVTKSPIWDYFRIAVSNGWITNTGIPDMQLAINIQTPLTIQKGEIINPFLCVEEVKHDVEDAMKRANDFEYDLRTPLKMGVSFEERLDDYWLWTITGENKAKFLVNNKSFNQNRADQVWLSMIAMVAVERLITGKPEHLMLDINSQAVLNESAVSYILILSDKTNCLNGWCHFHFDETTISDRKKLQLGYVAWHSLGRDMGMCDRWYSGAEKLKYMHDKFDLQEGDLVFFYTRDKGQRRDYIKSVASCRLAKIIKIDAFDIDLELINTTSPYYQGKLNFDSNTIAVKKMYGDVAPYEHFNTSHKHMSMADLGIEYMLYNEIFFIVPLSVSDDVKIVTVSDGKRVDRLYLPQNDLVYWILKDYKYAFNEERFLEKLFKDSEPVYTRYMRGDTLEDYYYYKETTDEDEQQ